MNVTPINFCKKIPVNQIQVIDKVQKRPVEATVYEYDCEDLDDIYEVGDLDLSWSFGEMIASNMHRQFLKNKIMQKDDSLHYYCVKDGFNRMLGLCQTVESKDSIDVKLIVSHPNQRYKYIGQAMLATLGQKVVNQDIESLKVRAALSDVYRFYEDGCGFKRDLSRGTEIFGRDYKMENKDIPGFIQRTKEKIELY